MPESYGLKLITRMIMPMTTKMDEDDLDMFEGDDSFEDFGFEGELELDLQEILRSRAKINDFSIMIILALLFKKK
jgi:hypothetical protein